MLHPFLLWLIATLSAMVPVCGPGPTVPAAGGAGSYTQHDGAVIVDERAPDIGEPATLEADPPACQEDEACWDCATMGNLVCGPDPTVPPTLTWPTCPPAHHLELEYGCVVD